MEFRYSVKSNQKNKLIERTFYRKKTDIFYIEKTKTDFNIITKDSIDFSWNDDKQYINNFVDNELFAQDSRFIRDQIKQKTPDMDMSFVFTSNITGESQVMDIPMDVSFFWPRA